MAIGLAATTTINNGFKGIVLFLPFVILGSLLPDVDVQGKSLIKSSKIKTLFAIIILGYLYFNQDNKLAQLGIVMVLAISFIYSKTKHRTLSHSLIGLAMLILPIGLISLHGAYWFGFGYATHLISDSLTVSGVPFFYPLSKKTLGFKICKASGMVDLMIRIASIGIIAYTFI